MKIAIIGTRTATDYERLKNALDAAQILGGITEIISGGAAGADAMAERYAQENGIKMQVINADWKKYGKAAGPMRNTEIVEAAQEIYALWDGQSTGTADTIRKAQKAGKKVHILRYEEQTSGQMCLF